MNQKVLVKSTTQKSKGFLVAKIFTNHDDKTVLLRNRFISRITGKNICKSIIVSAKKSNYESLLFTAICRTQENKTIKVEIMYDNTQDKNKILSIYYTSKFIENCYMNNLVLLQNADTFQIRLTDFIIFDDDKLIHDFYYSDKNHNRNQIIKLSYVELPKL